MLRHLTTVILCFAATTIVATAQDDGRFIDQLPKNCEIVDGYDFGVALDRQKHYALDPIEGIWQLTADGGLVSIEAVKDEFSAMGGVLRNYRMIIVHSPDRAVLPGSVMGHISPTAKPGTFDAKIYTTYHYADSAIRLTKPQKILLVLKDDNLQFHPVRKGLKVKWLRLLPYMFRRAFDWESEKRDGLDGAVRYRQRLPIYL